MDKKKEPYKLIRVVTPQECHWLRRTYKAGEIVFKFYGDTYGCIGKKGLAFCHVIDTNPYFELPKDAVSIIQ